MFLERRPMYQRNLYYFDIGLAGELDLEGNLLYMDHQTFPRIVAIK